LGLANQDVTFSKNEYGKPYLRDYPGFRFNISHTRSAIAVAFSNSDIGVDIEHVKSPDIKIAERFFTLQESELIVRSKNPDQAFCEIWTAKEAYIKFQGEGLSIPLNSFNVLDEAISSLIHTFLANEYIISVCGNETNAENDVLTVITEDELLIRLTGRKHV